MLFEGTTDAGVFNLWLKARLLPELPERAVLVMDNAAKACRRLDGNPDVPECKGVKLEQSVWITRAGPVVLADSPLEDAYA